jgi:hypothetical protein
MSNAIQDRWYGSGPPAAETVDQSAARRTKEMLSEVIAADGALYMGSVILTPRETPQGVAQRWYAPKGDGNGQ